MKLLKVVHSNKCRFCRKKQLYTELSTLSTILTHIFSFFVGIGFFSHFCTHLIKFAFSTRFFHFALDKWRFLSTGFSSSNFSFNKAELSQLSIILVVFYKNMCYNKNIPEEGVDFMRYIISGKNIDITPGLREAVEGKIGKLERYFSPDTEVQVTMSVEKGRQKIEVTIPVKGHLIRAEQDSSDMYVSIDLVEEIIERQIKKYKTKLIDKKQSALSFSEAFLQEESEADENIKIVKTKRFAMKPMDPEEACIQMELLGHNFFMFLNAETNEVNVVYKRKANSYGLIEPEF